MDLRLDGKVVLITGGSAGLGKALAKVLVREGAKVAICARREDKLRAAAEEIGGDLFAQVADIAKPAEIANFVEAAAQRFGAIDGVANNAGSSFAAKFQDLSDDDWETDLNLKVLGAIRVSRAALPHLKRSNDAAIVNVLNATAKAPRPGSFPSSLSRAAGLALTKGMSFDLADEGVRVNAICNGYLHSEQWPRMAQERGMTEQQLIDKMVAQSGLPAGRFGEDHEWAKVAAFLLSPASSYVNGAALNVDGGLAPVV